MSHDPVKIIDKNHFTNKNHFANWIVLTFLILKLDFSILTVLSVSNQTTQLLFEIFMVFVF